MHHGNYLCTCITYSVNGVARKKERKVVGCVKCAMNVLTKAKTPRSTEYSSYSPYTFPHLPTVHKSSVWSRLLACAAVLMKTSKEQTFRTRSSVKVSMPDPEVECQWQWH